MSWWTRFLPHKSLLPAVAITTLLCGVGLILTWSPKTTTDAQMAKISSILAHSLAQASAGHLLNVNRIELAVIAANIVSRDEVAGVIFYNTQNEIIVVSGNSEGGNHHTAPATLDDTITGYVSVILAADAFAPPSTLPKWLYSFLIVLGAPLLSLLLLQLTARGNRSIPIVSVPEPTPAVPQNSFCLTINLHNQLALNSQDSQQALYDALDMANEACAIHQGITVEVPKKGIIVLFDQTSVSANNAVNAAFLVLNLLNNFETKGEFRYVLSETISPDAPGSMHTLAIQELEDTTDVDSLLTLATLAKSNTILTDQPVFEQLEDTAELVYRKFQHPLLGDYLDSQPYLIEALAEQQNEWVENQASLILGFS